MLQEILTLDKKQPVTRDSSVHHRLKPCKKERKEATENAENADSEFSMAVRNSAGSRIHWMCMRVHGQLTHVAEFFYPCPLSVSV